VRKEKIPASDFTKAMLPHTRGELFQDLLKHQFGLLVKVSLLLALFALPLFADYLVFSLLISGAYLKGSTAQQIFALFFYASLISWPCFIILNLGYTGAFEVAKRLSFSQGVIEVASFFQGLKDNWKKGLAIGTLSGFSFALALVGIVYLLLFLQSKPVWLGIGIGLLSLGFLVIQLMVFFFHLQNCIYVNSAGAVLKNSFIFSFLRFPSNLGMFILFPGIILALFCINDITAYVGIGVFVFFSFLGILGWTLYMESVFDRFINREFYPELVNKGLAGKEE
jgi:hypothetical protein